MNDVLRVLDKAWSDLFGSVLDGVGGDLGNPCSGVHEVGASL